MPTVANYPIADDDKIHFETLAAAIRDLVQDWLGPVMEVKVAVVKANIGNSGKTNKLTATVTIETKPFTTFRLIEFVPIESTATDSPDSLLSESHGY